jgi:hypothetical protein
MERGGVMDRSTFMTALASPAHIAAQPQEGEELGSNILQIA